MTLKEYLNKQLKEIVPDPDSYIGVNNNPKIVFVNGYWTKYFKFSAFRYEFDIGPAEGGENYWVNQFVDKAKEYFNITLSEKKFADGSSKYGGDQNGQDRVLLGEDWTKRNYNYLTSNSQDKLDFYFVGHSEGGAFAVGIANYLNSKGHNIKEILLLSCDEADEFKVNSDFPTFQIVLGFWRQATLQGLTIWDIRVDWVVGNHRLIGSSKYGVIIGNYGITTVHGGTNAISSFNKSSDLKSVIVTPFYNQLGQMYHTQSNTPNETKFYSINNISIPPNHPGWDPNTKTIIY